MGKNNRSILKQFWGDWEELQASKPPSSPKKDHRATPHRNHVHAYQRKCLGTSSKGSEMVNSAWTISFLYNDMTRDKMMVFTLTLAMVWHSHPFYSGNQIRNIAWLHEEWAESWLAGSSGSKGCAQSYEIWLVVSDISGVDIEVNIVNDYITQSEHWDINHLWQVWGQIPNCEEWWMC